MMQGGRPRLDRRKPECRQVELNCDECIRKAAENVAFLAPGATCNQLRLYFQSMFPEQNCQSMAQVFVHTALPPATARKQPRYTAALAEAVAAA